MLANAATVVAAQVPIARLAEERRRVVMMTLAAALWPTWRPRVCADGTWRRWRAAVAALRVP